MDRQFFMYPLGKTRAELIPSGSEKKIFLWLTPLKPENEYYSSTRAGKTAGISCGNILKALP